MRVIEPEQAQQSSKGEVVRVTHGSLLGDGLGPGHLGVLPSRCLQQSQTNIHKVVGRDWSISYISFDINS